MSHTINKTVNLIQVLILVGCLTTSTLVQQTNQPFFGVLTQPVFLKQLAYTKSRPNELSMSYILKMYDQMITSAGGMTMVIPYDLPIRKLNEVLPYLNGILIPDGKTGSRRDGEYSQRVSFITHWAQSRNLEGYYFSIIAIGKGYHELMVASNWKDGSILECNYEDFNVSRKLTIDMTALRETNYLKNLSESDMNYTLSDTHSAPFNHNCSISEHRFRELTTLTQKYNIIATAKKDDFPTFVALIEHKIYPFVGMQFKPENAAFKTDSNIYKDRRQIAFYRRLISKFIFGGGSSNLKAIDDMPLNIQNLLMYKDIPILGYHTTGHIYLYRRWMAGRDIDTPTN